MIHACPVIVADPADLRPQDEVVIAGLLPPGWSRLSAIATTWRRPLTLPNRWDDRRMSGGDRTRGDRALLELPAGRGIERQGATAGLSPSTTSTAR